MEDYKPKKTLEEKTFAASSAAAGVAGASPAVDPKHQSAILTKLLATQEEPDSPNRVSQSPVDDANPEDAAKEPTTVKNDEKEDTNASAKKPEPMSPPRKPAAWRGHPAPPVQFKSPMGQHEVLVDLKQKHRALSERVFSKKVDEMAAKHPHLSRWKVTTMVNDTKAHISPEVTMGDKFEIVLSEAATKTNVTKENSVVTKLVDSYLEHFYEEGGPSNQRSNTVDLVIYRLLTNYSPTLLYQQPDSGDTVPLTTKDCLKEGKRYPLFVRKIRDCFVQAHETKVQEGAAAAAAEKTVAVEAGKKTTVVAQKAAVVEGEKAAVAEAEKPAVVVDKAVAVETEKAASVPSSLVSVEATVKGQKTDVAKVETVAITKADKTAVVVADKAAAVEATEPKSAPVPSVACAAEPTAENAPSPAAIATAPTASDSPPVTANPEALSAKLPVSKGHVAPAPAQTPQLVPAVGAVAGTTVATEPKPVPVVVATKVATEPKPVPVVVATKVGTEPKSVNAVAATKSGTEPKPVPAVAATTVGTQPKPAPAVVTTPVGTHPKPIPATAVGTQPKAAPTVAATTAGTQPTPAPAVPATSVGILPKAAPQQVAASAVRAQPKPAPTAALVEIPIEPKPVAQVTGSPPNSGAKKPPPEAFLETRRRPGAGPRPGATAPKTPERSNINYNTSHMEATPIATNTTTGKTKTKRSTKPAVAGTTPRFVSALPTKRKFKEEKRKQREASKKRKSDMMKGAPMVTPIGLTYDWSALNLNGTASWNRMLKQRMLDDPVAHPTVPQVNALDTYQLMQDLKNQTHPLPPPQDSPLHAALCRMVPPTAKEKCQAFAQGRPVRWSTNTPPPAPASCPEDLRHLYPRMARTYQGMVAQDATDPANSNWQRAYQFMTASEIRQHMIDAEQDVAALAVKEERVLRTAKKLGLFNATQPKAGDNEADEKDKPVFWQKNFSALLKSGNPLVKYLMLHDQV